MGAPGRSHKANPVSANNPQAMFRRNAYSWRDSDKRSLLDRVVGLRRRDRIARLSSGHSRWTGKSGHSDDALCRAVCQPERRKVLFVRRCQTWSGRVSDSCGSAWRGRGKRAHSSRVRFFCFTIRMAPAGIGSLTGGIFGQPGIFAPAVRQLLPALSLVVTLDTDWRVRFVHNRIRATPCTLSHRRNPNLSGTQRKGGASGADSSQLNGAQSMGPFSPKCNSAFYVKNNCGFQKNKPHFRLQMEVGLLNQLLVKSELNTHADLRTASVSFRRLVVVR